MGMPDAEDDGGMGLHELPSTPRPGLRQTNYRASTKRLVHQGSVSIRQQHHGRATGDEPRFDHQLDNREQLWHPVLEYAPLSLASLTADLLAMLWDRLPAIIGLTNFGLQFYALNNFSEDHAWAGHVPFALATFLLTLGMDFICGMVTLLGVQRGGGGQRLLKS